MSGGGAVPMEPILTFTRECKDSFPGSRTSSPILVLVHVVIQAVRMRVAKITRET